METKNKKGFTLVELLVVIAIIGILSTVAVVNLNSSRKKAKETAALQSIASYTTAAILCDHEEGAILNNPYPSGSYVGGNVCSIDIGVDWPELGELPEEYDYIIALDGPGSGGSYNDGVWIFLMDDAQNVLTEVVCEQSFSGRGDGCRIGW